MPIRPSSFARLIRLLLCFCTALLPFILTACRLSPPVIPAAASPTPAPKMFTWFNLAYRTIPGCDPNLTKLDIYAPSNAQSAPVMIFIHGGGWSAGDKAEQMTQKAAAFTSQGYVFVSINYRLTPEVMHPVHAQDTAAAIAWVYANIGQYGGSPQRLFLMGHSAGAQLAGLVATDERLLQAHNLGLDKLKGVVLLDGGGYDIPATLTDAETGNDAMFKAAFGLDPAVWQDASPRTHVQPGKQIPPFLLIHAGARAASRSQAYALAGTLLKASIPAQIFHAPDKDHGGLNADIGSPGDAATQAIFAFLAGLQ